MRCNRCGAENAPESRFCQQCGAELSQMPGAMPPQGMMTPGYGMPPMQKKNNNTLWIILAAVGGVLIITIVILIVVISMNKPVVVKAEDDDDKESPDIELVEVNKASTTAQSPTTSTRAPMPKKQAPVGGSLYEIANMDFSSGYVSQEFLNTHSSKELRVARNAIFARHGRYFKSKDLQQIFGSCSWYSPWRNEVPASEFNRYEKANIETLKAYE